MTLSEHVTLKDLSKKHRINYHTLRRRVLKRLSKKIQRVGRTILINRLDVRLVIK